MDVGERWKVSVCVRGKGDLVRKGIGAEFSRDLSREVCLFGYVSVEGGQLLDAGWRWFLDLSEVVMRWKARTEGSLVN